MSGVSSSSSSSAAGGPGPERASTGGRRRIGQYLVVRELGRGSHGVVYLVRREELQREFALKVLLGHAAQDPELRQRFRLEAAVAGRLQHPGIVRVVDVGDSDGHPWLVMDYVAGPTLREHLRERGALPPAQAGRIVCELADAVAVAHAQQIVHRDLKPANAILDAQTGRACVTDFGLARDEALVRAMTHSGVILGTPYYMSPEQLHGQRADARADVWALGVILYECLSGQRPFEARTPLELARAMDGTTPRRLSGVPAALEAVCLRALAHDPRERFASAGELATALGQVLGALKDGAAPRGNEQTEVRRAPPPLAFVPAAPARSRGAAVAVAAGVLLLGVGGAAGAWLSRGPHEPAAPPSVGASPTPPAPPLPPDTVTSAPPVAPPPPPPDQAPPTEVLALEERLLKGRVSSSDAMRLGELRGRFPDDPEVRYLLALSDMGGQRREHELRRELVRAALGPVRLHESALDKVGRFSHMLGFERAGAWVAEQAWDDAQADGPTAGAPDPPQGAFLIQLYLKAAPPVQDCARARWLIERLLRRKEPGTDLDYPARWMLYAHQVDAAVGLRDLPGAIAAQERCVAAPGGEQTRALLAQLRAQGLPPPEAVGDMIHLVFASSRLLNALGSLDDAVPQDPAGVEARLAQLAIELVRDDQPEMAATVLLRAARAARRANGPPDSPSERALVHLDAAVRLKLPREAADTRALVCRAAARACLEQVPPDSGRAAHLAEEALEAGPPGWEEVRTPAEQVDALILLARARLLRADSAGAQAALDRAEALAPRDRRELDQVAASLRR